MRIAMTSIFVHDPVKAFEFYTKVLGFKERIFFPELRLAIVVSSDEPMGTGLLLEPNDNPIAKTYQEGIYNLELPVIVFGVKHIHKEYEHLKNKGVIFRHEPTATQAGVQAIFEDTCGNLVQLYEASS
jgi:catechol 2,3-dioxygenase-like lactoylglutathione lyase family enzyme